MLGKHTVGKLLQQGGGFGRKAGGAHLVAALFKGGGRQIPLRAVAVASGDQKKPGIGAAQNFSVFGKGLAAEAQESQLSHGSHGNGDPLGDLLILQSRNAADRTLFPQGQLA